MTEQETKPAASEQKDPNLAVVDRMRDLAKWLIVVFGAIGGALIAGTELSDVGSAEGWDLFWACVGVLLGIAGAGLALAFTVIVLLPTGISLRRLASGESNSELGKRVREEPEALYGLGATINEFKTKIETVREEANQAQAAYEADSGNESLQKAAERTRAKREGINRCVEGFLNWAMLITVKEKMVRAVVATFVGGILVVAGITVFSVATNGGGSDAEAAEAVPKQPSVVTVRLTKEGQIMLVGQLGESCVKQPLKAIALDGDPDTLELVSVPTGSCEATRFTLTDHVGIVISEEGMDPLPPCPLAKPDPPCITY